MEGLILMKSLGLWLKSRIATIGDSAAGNHERCFALLSIAFPFHIAAWVSIFAGIVCVMLGSHAGVSFFVTISIWLSVIVALIAFSSLFWRFGHIWRHSEW